MAGKPAQEYKIYRRRVERFAERQIDHSLSVYDILVKFILEGRVKRIIGSEGIIWREAIDFGNVPDAWIQFDGGEVFVEADRGTEEPIVLEKKFANYVRFHNSGRYGRLFPACGFKVLVLTTTEERIESLEERTKSDDIWFCTSDEFLREPLDHAHWFAACGFYALPVIRKEEMQELQKPIP